MSTPATTLTLIIGATGGLGHALTAQVLSNSPDAHVLATCRRPSDSLTALQSTHQTRLTVLPSVDLLSDDPASAIITAVKAHPHALATVYFVAGLLVPDTLHAPHEPSTLAMYRVCAVAPLRIASALFNAGLLNPACKLALITSEGGSIGLRTHREGGGSYGHHMSKAASNMLGRLLAIDLKPHGVPVVCLHPGFLRTAMTEHYADSYDDLGAVQPEVSAAAIIQAVERLTLESTGKFIAPLGDRSLGFGVYALEGGLEPFGELPW